MLQEGAIDLVADHVPPTSHADLVAGLLAGQRQLHALGITGWQDAIVRPDAAGGVRGGAAIRPADRPGVGWRCCGTTSAAWSRSMSWWSGETAAAADGLAAGSVKLFVDGIIENRTAVTVEPYLDPDGRAGATRVASP